MPKPKKHTGNAGRSTWRVRFRHRGRETSETFLTEKAAKAFCNDIEHRGVEYAVAALEAELLADDVPRLDEVTERWFEWKAGRVRSDRTIADYRRDYRRHLSPALGNLPVTLITDVHVQQTIDALVPLISAKTVCDRHALLHGILSWAASASGGKLIAANPAVGTDLPRRKPTAPKSLTPAEWWALHAALNQINPDAADLAAFLLYSGWRWSEATALDRWNLEPIGDGSRLRVTMANIVRRGATGGFSIVSDDGKARASLRSIKLSRAASQMILARIADDDRESDLVFTNENGSRWHQSNFRDRAWEPAVKVANLSRKPTPHWLRHTHVVWAARSGANLAELQSRLGHASITTTINTYGRALTDVSDDVLDDFEALATPPPIEQPAAIEG